MDELTTQEMEATRGGFFNHSTIAATIGNSATSVNVATLIGAGNRSGGVTVAQEADSSAGNIAIVH
jgi:hypothetical protein